MWGCCFYQPCGPPASEGVGDIPSLSVTLTANSKSKAWGGLAVQAAYAGGGGGGFHPLRLTAEYYLIACYLFLHNGSISHSPTHSFMYACMWGGGLLDSPYWPLFLMVCKVMMHLIIMVSYI